jgi:hypothetical protein
MKTILALVAVLGSSTMAFGDQSLFSLDRVSYKDPAEIAKILSLNGKQCGVFNILGNADFQGLIGAGFHVDSIDLRNGAPGEMIISASLATVGETPSRQEFKTVCYQ